MNAGRKVHNLPRAPAPEGQQHHAAVRVHGVQGPEILNEFRVEGGKTARCKMPGKRAGREVATGDVGSVLIERVTHDRSEDPPWVKVFRRARLNRAIKRRRVEGIEPEPFTRGIERRVASVLVRTFVTGVRDPTPVHRSFRPGFLQCLFESCLTEP